MLEAIIASSRKFYQSRWAALQLIAQRDTFTAINGGAPEILVLRLPVACKPQSPVKDSPRRRSRTSSFDTRAQGADDAGEGEVSSPSSAIYSSYSFIMYATPLLPTTIKTTLQTWPKVQNYTTYVHGKVRDFPPFCQQASPRNAQRK